MAPSPPESEDRHAGDRRAGEEELRPGPERDSSAIPDDIESASFPDYLEKARRLVALELDLAETRRGLAEDNLRITEAQLELAEEEIARLKAENERLRREIEDLRGGREST